MTEAVTSREVLALRSLHDVITAIHGRQDLEEVLQSAAQGVVDALGFEVAVIDCVDDHGYVEALAVAGQPDAVSTMKSRRIPLSEILAEFDIAEEWGLLRFVPHDRLDPDTLTSWIPDIEPLDVPDAWHPLDALYAPLNGPTGELVGVLSVDVPVNRRRPSPLARQVLEMFAVQAGLAIHHAQEWARLTERVRLGAAVRTVVETVSRELDLQAIIDASFGPLSDGFRCDRLLVRVLDQLGDEPWPGTDRPAPGAGSTYPPGLLDWLRPRLERLGGDVTAYQLVVLGERIARDCWSAKATCIVDAVLPPHEEFVGPDDLALLRTMMSALDATSVMLVPLGSGPQCVGYLTMVRDKGDPFSEAESEAALEVGREVGRAVHRTHLYQRERELVAELQELDRHKGEMIATITHELKNPLTAIRGYAEMLSEQGVGGRAVEAIERNVMRLVTLADDLLLLAKVSDPHRALMPSPVPMLPLLDEVCEAVGVQAQLAEISLRCAEVPADAVAVGERDELVRMLVNVVGNAVKYTPAGGQVTLAVTREGARVVFRCTDTGLGIGAEDLGRLFDEFDRSSNPQAQSRPGSGLGLAIVKRIVDRHGGELHVESELGVGSTFTIALPAA
jgi:signal transduction histidine kinase